MKSVARDVTVGRIATEHPPAARVFERHGIDYWCGGGRALSAACAETGVDVERVLREVEQELAGSPGVEERWDEAPLEALIDHVVTSYHRPLESELARLEETARRVVAAHGDEDPRLAQLLTAFVFLKSDLEQHMFKEEQMLFPEIRAGDGPLAQDAIAMMEEEHVTSGEVLRTLRSLADEYRLPEWADRDCRNLWNGLAAFEEALHRHVHLENNVLFPRALEG